MKLQLVDCDALLQDLLFHMDEYLKCTAAPEPDPAECADKLLKLRASYATYSKYCVAQDPAERVQL